MQMKNLIVFVCGLLLSTTIWAQQKTITGNVSDETGQPLPGVNVIVEGTTVGTVSTPDGTFSLDVPAKAGTLLVSFIGYKTQKIDIVSTSNVSVQLELDAIGLEEVVAVGYGTMKKVNLTGSVATISGEVLTSKPVAMASMALQGVASGVTVTQSTGFPGEDKGTIRIRGIGTLGNSNPLILIDGFSGDLNRIDPNDIESISVLKDAAAAAIYGSRAANGVILVTTKRGKKGKVKLNYRGFFGWQKFTDNPEYVDGETYMTKHNEGMINVGKTPLWSDEYMSAYKTNSGLYSYEYPDIDYQDLYYDGSGFQHNHNLSISGGNETLSSMLSLSYLDQKGIVKPVGYKRYGVRINNDYKLSDKIQFKFDLNIINSVNDYTQGSGGITASIQRYSPLVAVYTPDKKYSTNYLGYPNAIASLYDSGYLKKNGMTIDSKFAMNVQPIDGMNLNFTYSPNYSTSYQVVQRIPVELYTPGTEGPSQVDPNLSTLKESFYRSYSNSLNLVGTYTKSFGNHTIDLMGGYEQIDWHTTGFWASRENFPFIEYAVLNNGSEENKKNGGTKSEWALRSYFGRAKYDFSGKYLLEANIRYDGSSRFAPGNKYGLFPSASAAWRVSEESFMDEYDWIDNLKLKASWGEMGNQNIGTYPYVSVVSLGQNYVFNNKPVNGAALTKMANEMITWETASTLNFGLEVGLFNKISAGFEYYVRNTRDILLTLPVPGTIGLKPPYQNAGKVKNVGWDFNLMYRNHDNEFKYSVGAVLSDVKNEIVDLYESGPYIYDYSIRRVGDPMDALYLLESDGLFQTQDEIDNHATQIGTVAPGDIKYVDQITVDTDGDGIPDATDGKINAEDKIVVGSNIPRYSYGLDLSANYKGFDMTLFLQGVGKRQSFYKGQVAWPFYNIGNIQKYQLDSWTPENKDAGYPRLIVGSSHNNFQSTDYYMYNSSYLRVKTFQLGYTIPGKTTKKLGIDKFRVYGSANNLFTFTGVPPGWDPEQPQGSSFQYPITASYVFGVDITF